MDTWDGVSTSLDERIGICQEIEFLVIPGYLRKELEQEFTCLADYLNRKSLYHEFYSFLAIEIELSNVKYTAMCNS